MTAAENRRDADVGRTGMVHGRTAVRPRMGGDGDFVLSHADDGDSSELTALKAEVQRLAARALESPWHQRKYREARRRLKAATA